MNSISNLVESAVSVRQKGSLLIAYMFISLKVFRVELPSPKCGGLRANFPYSPILNYAYGLL